MNYNRRKFIGLGIAGTAGLLIPGILGGKAILGETLSPNSTVTSGNLQTALALARDANVLRLAKSYDQAELKYRQAIQLVPNDIRFYDGLRKVLVMQKTKLQQMVELYQNGYRSNPKVAAFAARLADVYCQTEMGNKSLAETIKQKSSIASLADEAQKLYATAISLNTKNKDYPVSQVKLGKLKENSAFVKDARQNAPMKQFRKQNEATHRNKVDSYTAVQLKAHLLNYSKKTRRVLSSADENTRQFNIGKNKKETYQHLLKKYKDVKDWSSAKLVAEQLHTAFPNDRQGFHLLKKQYINNKNWSEAVSLIRKKYNEKPTLWSGLGLMKILELQATKSGSGNIGEAISIGDSLLTKAGDNIRLQIAVLSMVAHNYGATGQYSDALQKLNAVKDILVNNGVSQPNTLNRFFSDYALMLAKSGNGLEAERVLNIALGKQALDQDTNDIFMKLYRQKAPEGLAHRKDMEIALAKVYLQTNPAKSAEQLLHIRSVYPNEQFAIKRL